jgi:hypothetical protein
MAEDVVRTTGRPQKSEIPPRLRHRSKCESENGAPEASNTQAGSMTSAGQPFLLSPDEGHAGMVYDTTERPAHERTRSPSGTSKMAKNHTKRK